MYAIIDTGGQQHSVAPQDEIDVNFLDAQPGEKVEFDKVLFVKHDKKQAVGTPYVEGCKVKAEVVADSFGEKLTVFRFKRRKNSRTKTGHRQKYTRVRILEITQ